MYVYFLNKVVIVVLLKAFLHTSKKMLWCNAFAWLFAFKLSKTNQVSKDSFQQILLFNFDLNGSHEIVQLFATVLEIVRKRSVKNLVQLLGSLVMGNRRANYFGLCRQKVIVC